MYNLSWRGIMFTTKPIKIALLCLGIMLSSTTHALAFPQISEKDLINQFTDSLHYAGAHQTEIWPGFKLSNVATILEFDPSEQPTLDYKRFHLYAFDFQPANPLWQKINIQGSNAYYMPQNPIGLEESLTLIDNQIVLPFRADPFMDVTEEIVNMHAEKFMLYFMQHTPLDELKENTQSFLHDENNLRLTALEIEAMKTYLKSNDVEALKDMLALRQYRIKSLTDDIIKNENTREKERGVALYVGIRSANLDSTNANNFILHRIERNAPDLASSNQNFLTNFREYVADSIGHNSGAVLALALERVGDNQWKSAVQDNAEPLITLLEKHYAMNETEINQRALSASDKYHFTDFSAKLKSALTENETGAVEAQNTFSASTGIKVHVVTQVDNNALEGTDWTHVLFASFNQTIFNGNNFTKYLHSSNVQLELRNIPIVIENNSLKVIKILPNDNLKVIGNEETNTFKLPINASIVMDGQTTTLNALTQKSQTLKFHKIENENVSITLENNLTGELITQNGEVTIKLIS
ncbi:MAG: hypothetical protein SFW66_06640 [Gammaproteobacteria bacterium]|nr:hypothetical protein [Gammaproteobacteria bacterium]